MFNIIKVKIIDDSTRCFIIHDVERSHLSFLVEAVIEGFDAPELIRSRLGLEGSGKYCIKIPSVKDHNVLVSAT